MDRKLLSTAAVTLFSPLLLSAMFAAPSARRAPNPLYPCTCVITWQTLPHFSTTAPGMIPPNLTVAPQSDDNMCAQYCSVAASAHYMSQSVATNACAAGAPNGAVVRAYAKTSGMPPVTPDRNTFHPVNDIGTLIRVPAVARHEWRCPPAWLSNTTNQPGGVTGDQKCKKLAGGLTLTPHPAPGTQIGNWGFTWNHEVWGYGTPANGGAPIHIVINTPGICRF